MNCEPLTHSFGVEGAVLNNMPLKLRVGVIEARAVEFAMDGRTAVRKISNPSFKDDGKNCSTLTTLCLINKTVACFHLFGCLFVAQMYFAMTSSF